MTFPKDFTWGVATAAFQVEGASKEDGRGASIWDTFCDTPGKVANGDNGEVACDHYHRYLDDIKIMQEIGVKSYRLSIAWPRLFPQGDQVREDRGFAFYDKLIDALIAAGIEPLVTLYHWDLPQPLEDKGGWADRQILDAFEFYATEVAKHFGDRVKRFSPINEPWVVSWLGYGIGVHAPGRTSRKDAFAAAHHTVMVHAIASRAIKKVRPDALVGPVLNQANFPMDDPNEPILIHANDVMDAQQNRWWIDAMYKGKYPEVLLRHFGDEINAVVLPGDLELASSTPNDFIGINYYFDNRMGLPGNDGEKFYDMSSVFDLDVDMTMHGDKTDMGWAITPEGLTNLLLRWHRELGDRCPDLYITENGCAYGDGVSEDGAVHDERRISYLDKHLKAMKAAIDAGSPVKGYYQWSLLDNFEWALGYEKRFGIVHVDFETQKRTLKDSALWYSAVVKSNGSTLA
jgi:beta-glucosidase